MSAKLAVVGAVTAGLVAVGGVAVASTWQPAQAPEPATVRMVQPAADTSTPTETATVAPIVVPTAVAPAPVESAPAPAPVVAPKPEVVVPKVVQPAAPDENASSVPRPTPGQPLSLKDGPNLAPNGVFGPGADAAAAAAAAAAATPTPAPTTAP